MLAHPTVNSVRVHTKVLYKVAWLLAALVAYGALGACDESPVPSVTSEFTPVVRRIADPAPTATPTLIPSKTPTPTSVTTLTPTPEPTPRPTTAPTRVATPAPTAAHTPVPISKSTPTPIRVVAPTPAADDTPASSPIPKSTPTPARAATPTPADDYTPTPSPGSKPRSTPTPTAESKPAPTSTPSPAVTATPTVAAKGPATAEPTKLSDPEAMLQDSAVLYNDVDITLGRAVLHLDGRVTMFYVAGDVYREFDGPIVIDSAAITSSGGMSWPADGHGELYYHAPLTLGWLTFPVSDASPGEFTVSVDSAMTGLSRITGHWQLRQLSGLAPRKVTKRYDLVNSGICVSSGDVAIGFHRQACPTEFYDMSPRRRSATPEATPASPSPSPTPTTTPAGISIQTNADIETQYTSDYFLIFVLCTPWHLSLHVLFDDTGKSEYTSNPPTTSSRCVLP